MTRDYCKDDQPFPVSAKAMRMLRWIYLLGSAPKHYAPAQFERLQRGGYIEPVPGGNELFSTTEAGRALLRDGRPTVRRVEKFS